MKKFIILFSALLIILGISSAPFSVDAQEDEEQPTVFNIRGTDPQIIGQYGDNFSYTGEDVRPQEWGFFEIHIDAETDTGLMISRFHVESHQLDAETLLEDAVVTVIYPLFGMPTDTMPDYWEGGIADYVDLHGDSGQEAPVLPTVFNDFGSWGPSLVFIDGERYVADEQFMGADNMLGLNNGHTMYSELVRNPETGEVLDAEEAAAFVPTDPSNGSIYSEEIELLHVVARSDTRDSENFPPFTMFLHVNFYNIVEIEPLEDVEFLTWEDMADMTPETWSEHVDTWLALADEIEAEVRAEESEDSEDTESDS